MKDLQKDVFDFIGALAEQQDGQDQAWIKFLRQHGEICVPPNVTTSYAGEIEGHGAHESSALFAKLSTEAQVTVFYVQGVLIKFCGEGEYDAKDHAWNGIVGPKEQILSTETVVVIPENEKGNWLYFGVAIPAKNYAIMMDYLKKELGEEAFAAMPVEQRIPYLAEHEKACLTDALDRPEPKKPATGGCMMPVDPLAEIAQSIEIFQQFNREWTETAVDLALRAMKNPYAETEKAGDEKSL